MWIRTHLINPGKGGASVLASRLFSEKGRLVNSSLFHSDLFTDHEPALLERKAGVSPARRARQRVPFNSIPFADKGRRDTCPTLQFMASFAPPDPIHAFVRAVLFGQIILSGSKERRS